MKSVLPALFLLMLIGCKGESITNTDNETEETENVSDDDSIDSSFYIDTKGEIDYFFDIETYEVEFRQFVNEFGYTFTSNSSGDSFSGTRIYYEFSPTPSENDPSRLSLDIDLPHQLLINGKYEIYDYRDLELDTNNTGEPISNEYNTMGLLVNVGNPSNPWTRGYLAESGALEIYTDSIGKKAGTFSGRFSKIWDSENSSIQENDTLRVTGKFYIKNP